MARLISWLETRRGEGASDAEELRVQLESSRAGDPAPVLGFTGTGGSGKSSVLDEIVRRFRLDHPDRSVGLLLIDPSRRRSGRPCVRLVIATRLPGPVPVSAGESSPSLPSGCGVGVPPCGVVAPQRLLS